MNLSLVSKTDFASFPTSGTKGKRKHVRLQAAWVQDAPRATVCILLAGKDPLAHIRDHCMGHGFRPDQLVIVEHQPSTFAVQKVPLEFVSRFEGGCKIREHVLGDYFETVERYILAGELVGLDADGVGLVGALLTRIERLIVKYPGRVAWAAIAESSRGGITNPRNPNAPYLVTRAKEVCPVLPTRELRTKQRSVVTRRREGSGLHDVLPHALTSLFGKAYQTDEFGYQGRSIRDGNSSSMVVSLLRLRTDERQTALAA